MLILNKQSLPSFDRYLCTTITHSGKHTLVSLDSDQSHGFQEYCMFAENLTLMEPQSQSHHSVEFWGSTSSVCLLSNVAVVPHSRTMDTYDPRSSCCLVMLNGFPGVSKLTIARSLQSSLTDQNVETRLIDDHLIIDPAEAVHPGRGHLCISTEHSATSLETQYSMSSRPFQDKT
jgi:hypothetical protein